MTTNPPLADYFLFRGEMWRVISPVHRQAGAGGRAHAYVRLQSMSGELAVRARGGGGMAAHRCPEPLWKCTRCGPVCGMTAKGRHHGDWSPCLDLDCLARAGGVHEHHDCPCMPPDRSTARRTPYCDLYPASQPECRNCPSAWEWPPDPADAPAAT